MTEPHEQPGGLGRAVMRGAGLATGGHLLTQVLTFATYLVLARLLTPHIFGEFAAGSIFVGLGLLVSESGLMAALVQRHDRLEEAASTAFVASVAGGIVMSLAALAVAPLAGLFFDSSRIAWVAAAMSGCIALNQAIIVPDALLQRRFSFVRRLVLEPGGALVSGGLAIGLAASGVGVWSLVAGAYAGIVVRVVLAWALVEWRPRLRLVTFAMWRELASFGRHVVAAEGIQVGYKQAQTALIGRVIGAAGLGEYGYALRIATQPVGVLINGIAYVLLPALARIAGDEQRFRSAAVRSLRVVSLIGFPASLVLFALGEPLTVLVFGEEWRAAGKAAAAMCALSLGTGVAAVAVEVWKASGQPQWLPKFHLFSTVSALVLLVAALPFGLTAVGASISVAATLAGGFALYGMVRVLRLRPAELARVIFPALAASVVMASILFGVEAVVHADRHSTLVGLLLVLGEAAAGLVLYVLALSLVSPETGAELRGGLRVLWSALQRRRSERVASPV